MDDIAIRDNEWISPREMHRGHGAGREPQIDQEVSKILGKPVFATDPRLLRLVVAWKKKTGSTPDLPMNDNYLYHPEFLTELRQVFNA